MAPSKALLDTDTLSAAAKRPPAVLAKLGDCLAAHGFLSFYSNDEIIRSGDDLIRRTKREK